MKVISKSYYISLTAAISAVLFLSSCGSVSNRQSAVQPKNKPNEDMHVASPVIYGESPLGEYVKRAFDGNTHFIRVLNKGDDALLAITHLIRNAQKTINIQTFIWVNDESGLFVFNELLKAAQRGVKVNIIVDDLSLRKIPDFAAYFATAHPNIRLKHYNPLAESISTSMLDLFKGWGMNFYKSNCRMHNKVFIADDQVGILGGRNYQNDYFDRGDQRNFKDRDVMVIGPEVKKMTDSFMEYWNDILSVSSWDMTDIKAIIDNRKDKDPFNYRYAGDHHAMFAYLNECASDSQCVKKRLTKDIMPVSRLEFISDKPGKREKIGRYKTTATSNALIKFLFQAQKEILIQTPYLVVGRKGTKIFKQQRKYHPDADIIISTNSLASSDHFYAYAFSLKNKKKYLKNFRWRIFELKPVPGDNDLIVPPVEGVVRDKKYCTCIHAKTFIFDNKIAWIGSFNVDPRSTNLNTEVALIIYDENVASKVKYDIMRDVSPENSWTIGKAVDIPIVSKVQDLTQDVANAVPIVDPWPLHYSTSFELVDGKKEVPFYDPQFYVNYKSVGPFPGADLTEKELKMRIIKALFKTAEPFI